MTKLDEMWVALAAYQPQADADGYGETWARMCSLKTYAAARAANAAANAEAAYYAAGAAYAAAVAAGAANAEAAYYAAAAAAAADTADADTADPEWAQKAINRIKKITISAQPAQPEQEPVAGHIGWLVRNSQGKLDLLTELQIDSSPEKYERLHKLYTTPPAQRKPLTDVIKAAQGVLEWTEIAHRPPIPDRLENGRMVRVRLHALAYLHDALAAHGIKEEA